MKTPLERIRRGAIVLGIVLAAAVAGFRFIAGYNWLDAIWMVVITISSVGYGERPSQPDHVQVLTIVVIVVGMSAAVYTIGGFIQLMTEGEIEQALGRRQMTRDIERLSGHVIVCGYGRIGQALSQSLKLRGLPFVVIDNNPDRIVEAQEDGVLCSNGDATEDSVLLACGIKSAKTLVVALPDDAANVFITLTARNLQPEIQIISRAELPTTEQKLRQAGADRVLLPTIMGARQMARMITHPSTADLMEMVAATNFLDIELDEITVGSGDKLAGVSIRETEAHQTHQLLVVAVKQEGGNMLFGPDADYKFAGGDIVIVMGRPDDIDGFRRKYQA